MITGHVPFKGYSEEITADISQWRKCLHRHIEEVVRVVISIKNKNDNKCIICKELSRNWTTQSSLANHYRWEHRTPIVEYYLENFIQLTPAQLQELMKIEDVQ